VNDLHAELHAVSQENMDLKQAFAKINDSYTTLSKDYDNLSKKLKEERNTTQELKNQIKWHQTKAAEDMSVLQNQLSEQKQQLHNMQMERTQFIVERERQDKQIFELQNDLQSKELQFQEELRNIDVEIEAVKVSWLCFNVCNSGC